MQAQLCKAARIHGAWLVSRATRLLAVVCVALTVVPASAQTLERIRDAGRIRFGYLADARPFTYRTEAGAVEGYGASLCLLIADQIEAQLARADLAVEWVPVTVDSRLREVRQGGIDLLCTPLSITLARRQEAAFSIPVFAAGNRAVLRADASPALLDALAEAPSPRPVWRGSPAAKVLEGTSFAVVSGTTTESWLAGRLATFQVDAEIVTVPDYGTALQRVVDRSVDVFFGERSVILGAMDQAASESLVILDRLFTQELAALALARGDEDFRLLVDTALSRLYASDALPELHVRWFGAFDDNTRAFFQWNTLAP